MQNLLNELVGLLEQDDRFVVEGKLLKNRIVECAMALDVGLIRLLLRNDEIRRHFFQDIDGVLVFDKVKFQQFVSNKTFLPDSYTTYKNKIGLTANGSYLAESQEVVLVWPYKDCILEGGQTEEEGTRNEVFWNEILAPDQIDRLLSPKVLTKFKKYDEKGQHSISTVSRDDNLIIKGNNLLALHTLETVYRNKVKLIYIDPPYNTGNDSFQYNDSFSRSTWLTFMLNRLRVAASLLAENGVFVIQLSDHRVAEAKLLLDEIFGRENFINQITVRTRSPSGFKTVNLGTFETAEYLYIYAKNKPKAKASFNPQFTKSEYDENYKWVIEDMSVSVKKWIISHIDEQVAKELGYKDVKLSKKTVGEDVWSLKKAEFAVANATRVFRYTEINEDASKEVKNIRDLSRKSPDKIFVSGEGEDKRFVSNGQQLSFYGGKVQIIDGEKVPTMLLTNIWTDIAWEGIANEGGVMRGSW